MNTRINWQKYKNKNTIFVLCLFVVLVIISISAMNKYKSSADITYDMALPESVSAESHVLFAGDVYWGRRMNNWSQQSALKTAYPFSKLSSLQRDTYDAWVANLECPAVSSVKQNVNFTPKLTDFNCDTDYLNEASKWFNVFSLANNHTSNQNKQLGVSATRSALDQNGIQYFGNYSPHISQDICEVISLPARAYVDNSQRKVMLPVAMCGYTGVHYTITSSEVQEIEAYSKIMTVIVMPHMGSEYTATVDSKRQALYRSMIDSGADIVLGNHPHWIQPTESYKGKLIAYSMGNFIFDQDFSEEVTRSAAFDATFTIEKSSISQADLNAWVKLGATCSTFKDTCLEIAQEQKLHKLPMNINIDVVGVDTSGKMTHRADQKLTQKIRERLNWTETSSGLTDNKQRINLTEHKKILPIRQAPYQTPLDWKALMQKS